MPLFRRKTAERQAKPPSSVQNVLAGSGLKRTPSNRSTRSLPHSPSSPDSWGEANDIGLAFNALNGNIPGDKRPRTLTLSESVLQDGQDVPADSLESPLRTSSRLSKTLLEVVRDKDALSCFKAFMKSEKAEHIIQFWCDAESFHASTLTRMRTHSLQNVSKGLLHKRRSESMRQINTEISPISGSESLVESTNNISSHVVTSSESRLQIPAGGNTVNQNEEILQKENSRNQNSTGNLTQHEHSKGDYSIGKNNPGSQIHSDSSSKDSQQKHMSDNTDGGNISKLSSGNTNQTSDSPLPSGSSAHTSNNPCDKTIPSAQTVSLNNPEHTTTNTVSADERLEPAATPTPQQPSNLSISEHSPSQPSILKSPSSESSHEDMALKLKKSIERDAVTIFSTYIAKDAPKPIGVDDTLRSEAISKICKEDGEVDPECFVSCQRFALDRLNSEYFQSFRDSAFHCRHQVNVMTTEKVYLPDILLNDNALCYFMEFMEQEGASDLMQMWLAADNFQQQLTATSGSYDGEQAQNDAMVIYDKYFSLQATSPIGFDDKLRFEIEGNICREGGPLPDCFTKAKNIVLKILEKMYFPNYLQSQVYYRYLSDLITTVQMSEDMPQKPYQKGHRRAESDASSEHSVGSQSTGAESVVSRNTLLAVDTRKQRKVGTIEGDFSMNLDMFNPDDLWKRPGANDLSLGAVDELGQFVSKFEHDAELDKKKGPVLFKRRKEKEKEEEEMALRIAQMIISDVNTMTKTGEKMTGKTDTTS